MGLDESWFFCVGNNLGKDLDVRPFEECLSLVNRYCLCKGVDESIDCMLFYCIIAGIFWQLVFSLFRL